jgi:hypothetical protein
MTRAAMSDQLQNLAERVTAIEAKLAKPADIPTPATDRRLSKKRLAERWGTSDRSIDRRRKDDPTFPSPDIVRGRCYWWLSKIMKYERLRARTADRTSDKSRSV